MENLKVKVSSEKESKEVQELFFELGYSFRGSENKNIEIFKHIGIFYLYAYSDGDLTFSNESDLFLSMKDHKEVTIPQLRDMVVLKRKSWKDATHETDRDDNDDLYYVSSDGKVYYWFCGDHWVYSGYCYRGNLKPISKTKEYLVKDPETNFYYVSNSSDDFGVVCEIPEGAEVVCYSDLNKDFVFYKDNGGCQFDKKWIKCGVEDESGTTYNNLTDFLKWGKGNEIIWQRNAQDEDVKAWENRPVGRCRTVPLNFDEPKEKHSHYKKDISHLNILDPYRISELYGLHSCADHIMKKSLCAGGRGHKDLLTDIQNIIDTAERWKKMVLEDANSSED